MTDSLQIRLLETPADHHRLQDAQEVIWGPGSAVVSDQTLAACKFGGIALGAFDGEALVGFCYGWPAYRDGRVWLHSHMLGVFPAYRNRGLGTRLKQAQMAEALRLGYRTMTWTFDPLESPNARLNIAKLGGTVREYLVDCYGPMTDALNQGIPSDRLLVALDLVSPSGTGDAQPDWPLINPEGCEPALGLTFPGLRLAIPPDYRAMYQSGEILQVLFWRLAVRKACLHYFERGYAITGFADGCYYLRQGDLH